MSIMDNVPAQQLQNRTMPSCTVIPVLSYENVEQAIKWLCTTFGFQERWCAGNHRAQLIYDGGVVVISEGVPGYPEQLQNICRST